ncbi:PDR/VanB family oxidoreductase [Acidocella sp.]|uniref:PDR/VanB family oxidoreductase n=1 Tax=Acidocella sp. TaxID=50710 RepID=UPI003D000D26
MKLTISAIDSLSPGLKRFTLSGSNLPWAGAGAHLILEIPDGERVRKNAYSLIGAPVGAYQIIVRRVEHSRGGSRWLHDHARPGDELVGYPPQNFFSPPRSAKRHLLLSAGIGITPFLAYLQIPGLDYELHHCCKSDEADAFRALLPPGANATLHTSRAALNLHALLAKQKLDTHLSICGPESFMGIAASAAKSQGWPATKVHLESFGAATGGKPFTVRLKRSGITLNVGTDDTLLDTLEAAGLNPPCLCRGGACGECRMAVLDGTPEHHDHYLSDADKASGKSIMVCVSRAITPELILDF